MAKHEPDLTTMINRCHCEIAEVEAQIRAGHRDLQGLCMALADWSEELNILQNEKRRRDATRRRESGGTGGTQFLTE